MAPHVHPAWPGRCDSGFGQFGTTSYGPVKSQPPFWPGTAENPPAVCACVCAGGPACLATISPAAKHTTADHDFYAFLSDPSGVRTIIRQRDRRNVMKRLLIACLGP